MSVLETFAVWTGWFYIFATIFIGIPVGWYWAATSHQEEPWTPLNAAVRTSISLWWAGAMLILLVTR